MFNVYLKSWLNPTEAYTSWLKSVGQTNLSSVYKAPQAITVSDMASYVKQSLNNGQDVSNTSSDALAKLFFMQLQYLPLDAASQVLNQVAQFNKGLVKQTLALMEKALDEQDNRANTTAQTVMNGLASDKDGNYAEQLNMVKVMSDFSQLNRGIIRKSLEKMDDVFDIQADFTHHANETLTNCLTEAKEGENAKELRNFQGIWFKNMQYIAKEGVASVEKMAEPMGQLYESSKIASVNWLNNSLDNLIENKNTV